MHFQLPGNWSICESTVEYRRRAANEWKQGNIGKVIRTRLMI